MATIEFDKVSKVFDDGTLAVSDLDLAIADGEPMVMVGRARPLEKSAAPVRDP